MEETDKEKKEQQPDAVDSNKPKTEKINDSKEQDNEQIETPETAKKKDTIFIYALIIIFVIFLVIIFLPHLIHPANLTLDELHLKNLQGKLPKDKGYLHNGLYSFVYYDGLWYTQLATPNGTKLFNIPFHYSPLDVQDIQIIGELNRSNLNRYRNFFVTFNPLDTNLNYIGVSIGETDSIIIQVFGKGVIAACTTNESDACTGRPIAECNSTSAPVFYFSSEKETNILYLNNCIIVAGEKENLLKATDRMLYDLLGII